MSYNVLLYFQRKRINADDIIYMTRQTPHTVLNLNDGRRLVTTIPMKELLANLPDGDFAVISKGIALRKSEIINISDQGLYTMIDGETFQGRRRNLAQHRQLREHLILAENTSLINLKNENKVPADLLDKCSIMQDMPLAFCIIELLFDKNDHGVDFVFRYCNDEMAVVEGVPLSDMINHSFYEVFNNGDRKLLISYADVALNGTKKILHDYSPEIDKVLTIHCYQPAPGYCACILIPS